MPLLGSYRWYRIKPGLLAGPRRLALLSRAGAVVSGFIPETPPNLTLPLRGSRLSGSFPVPFRSSRWPTRTVNRHDVERRSRLY